MSSTVGVFFDAIKARYPESLKQEIEWIFLDVLAWDRHQLVVDRDQPLSSAHKNKIEDSVNRLSGGEPLAYILGHQDFYKYRFVVSPAVLIPRADTELVVETALAFLTGPGSSAMTAKKIADLGAGSGCIGLSLLKDLPKARLWTCDVSPKAREIFAQNAKALDLEARVEYSLSDVSENMFENEYDAIVSNPPYIARDDERLADSVRRFEPSLALFAEKQGLAFYEKWLPWSYKALRQPGAAIFEFGEGQGPAILKLAGDAGFKKLELKKDLSGKDRVLLAIKD
jgi:release factor glutamine methyltransferase